MPPGRGGSYLTCAAAKVYICSWPKYFLEGALAMIPPPSTIAQRKQWPTLAFRSGTTYKSRLDYSPSEKGDFLNRRHMEVRDTLLSQQGFLMNAAPNDVDSGRQRLSGDSFHARRGRLLVLRGHSTGSGTATFPLGLRRLAVVRFLSQQHLAQHMQVPPQHAQPDVAFVAPFGSIPATFQAVAALQGVDGRFDAGVMLPGTTKLHVVVLRRPLPTRGSVHTATPRSGPTPLGSRASGRLDRTRRGESGRADAFATGAAPER